MRARRPDRRQDQPHPEFLDELLHPAPLREWNAWRWGPHRDATFPVPVPVVGVLANPLRLLEARRDVERIGWVKEAMRTRGIDRPLVLVVDHAGRVTLGDGHHRYLCAVDLGWERLPARLEVSEGIRTHPVPVHEVLAALLRVARGEDRPGPRGR